MSLCTSIPATRSYSTLTCGHLLQRHPPRTGRRHAAGQSPGQYRRLTHAHAAATGVPRQGSSQNLSLTRPRTVQAATVTTGGSHCENKTPRPATARTRPRRQGPSFHHPRQSHAVAHDLSYDMAGATMSYDSATGGVRVTKGLLVARERPGACTLTG